MSIIPAKQTGGLGDIDLDKGVLWIGHYKCMKRAELDERIVLQEHKQEYRKWRFINHWDQLMGLDPRKWEMRVEDHDRLTHNQITALKEWNARVALYA